MKWLNNSKHSVKEDQNEYSSAYIKKWSEFYEQRAETYGIQYTVEIFYYD